MKLARAVRRLSDMIDRAASVLLIALLVSMVLVTGLQIVCRVFFKALSWSEEVARYLLVWLTFIGAGCVYKRGGHINVLVVQNLFPKPLRKLLRVLVHLLCGAFFAMAVYYGIRYMGRTGSQLSAALRVPMSSIYTAMPLGFGIMLIHVADGVLSILTEKEEVEA